MTNTKGTAVITGASGGIGAIYADRLAERGYDLVLIARSADKLAQVAGRIRAKADRKVTVFPADLADAADLASVEAFLKAQPGITMLVNNAGLGGTDSLLDSDVDAMTSLIALNVTALTRLTYAVGAGLGRTRCGQHRQHRLGRRDQSRIAERRLRRLQGLRGRVQPEPAARTGRNRRGRAGRPAGRDGNRLLVDRGPACRDAAERDRDARR